MVEVIQQLRRPRFESEFESALDQVTDILKLERLTGEITAGKIKSSLIELAIPNELVVVGQLTEEFSILQKILLKINFKEFLETQEIRSSSWEIISIGTDSIDVLFTLLDLKRQYHDSVILMRGNHEAPNSFPFQSHSLPSEIQSRMPNVNGLYEKILSLFELLPLVTVIRGRLVLVHGGLPIETDYPDPTEAISQASRNDYELLNKFSGMIQRIRCLPM